MDREWFKPFALGHFTFVVHLAALLPLPKKTHILSTKLNIPGATAYN